MTCLSSGFVAGKRRTVRRLSPRRYYIYIAMSFYLHFITLYAPTMIHSSFFCVIIVITVGIVRIPNYSMHNFYDKSKYLITRYFITPRIDRSLLRSCVGPDQMQVNITQVEHFKTPSCTWFSHFSLTLPWPSLRRNRGLLVPSTGHLSLVHAS